MRFLVHGDDFVCAWEVEQLAWFKKKLKERFEIRSTTVGTNQSAGEVREARILNRIIRITEEGWEYEADQRHADLIVKETGADKLSTLTHPGGDKAVISAEGETESLVGLNRPGSEQWRQGRTICLETDRIYSTP